MLFVVKTYLRMVTSQHVDLNTSLVALADSDSGFGTRRVVKTDETTEDKVGFDRGTSNFSTLLDFAGVLLAGQSQDTETETGQSLHVRKDLLTELVGNGLGLLLAVSEVRGTALDNTLDGTLGESVIA